VTFKVRVQDFQSIADAEIEVSGLTVITGGNNSGKTALNRAIYGAFTNTKGSSFVRHGKDNCAVTLTFGDGKSVTWEKGAKHNRYTLDGKVLNKVGQGAPAELSTLGVAPVLAAGREIWPQFAQQFVGQVFLLDQPGSVLAESIADVDRVGVLNEALRMAQSDRRSLASELKVRQGDIVRLETQEKIFDGLDRAAMLVKDARDSHARVRVQQDGLAALRKLQDQMHSLKELLHTLGPVKDLKLPEDKALQRITRGLVEGIKLRETRDSIASLGILLGTLTLVKAIQLPGANVTQDLLHTAEGLTKLGAMSTNLRTLSTTIKALSPIREIHVPQEDVLARPTKISQAIGLISSIRDRIAPLTKLLDQSGGHRKVLGELSLPNPIPLQVPLGELTTFRRIAETASSLLGTVKDLRQELAQLSKGHEESTHQVKDLLGGLGDCPVCGSLPGTKCSKPSS